MSSTIKKNILGSIMLVALISLLGVQVVEAAGPAVFSKTAKDLVQVEMRSNPKPETFNDYLEWSEVDELSPGQELQAWVGIESLDKDENRPGVVKIQFTIKGVLADPMPLQQARDSEGLQVRLIELIPETSGDFPKGFSFRQLDNRIEVLDPEEAMLLMVRVSVTEDISGGTWGFRVIFEPLDDDDDEDDD